MAMCRREDPHTHTRATNMKAVVYDLQEDVFSVRDIPLPEPGDDEIRVKVLATALNPVDAKVAQWKGGLKDMSNIVLGLDVCGIVDKIGKDVQHLAVGEYVLYHGRMFQGHGGFAEYAIHDALTTISLGTSLPMDAVTLAATPCAAWTAYRALFDKLLVPSIQSAPATHEIGYEEPTLAIVGASGGVGSFALQLASLAGVSQIVAICSAQHESHVRSMGAHQFVDYRSEKSIHEGIQRVTNGAGVNRLLDCVGSATTKDAMRSVTYDGLIMPIVSFAEGDIEGFVHSHVFCQIALGAAHGQGLAARQRLKRCGERVTEMVLMKQLQVPVTQVISLEQVGPVLVQMLAANNTGKIVMKI